MSIESIEITDETTWLEQRLKDITSTEVSALFDLSPYKTAFELYHEKSNGVVVKIPENTRMKWGKRFEAPIAYGVAEDQKWSISKMNVYMRDTDARIGSSFDFRIDSSSDGPGIMEIKNVAELQYKRTWLDGEAPEHIELQIQHQMEVSGLKWTALVAMVGGNDPKIIYRNYDADIGKSIRAKVEAFWQMVETGLAPSADYSKDADIINKLYAQANQGEIFDATGDEEIARLVSQYQRAGKDIDDLEALRKAYRAQLLERIGTAEKVIGPWGSISCGRTKDTPPTLITPEMVGTSYGGRAGFRNFKVNMKKEMANV
jgi:putative phage-type endonuclease